MFWKNIFVFFLQQLLVNDFGEERGEQMLACLGGASPPSAPQNAWTKEKLSHAACAMTDPDLSKQVNENS